MMRQQRRLTLGQLALRAGVSKSTLSRWEAGTHWPRIPECLRVVDALGVTPSEQRNVLSLLDTPRAIIALRENTTSALGLSLGDLLHSLRLRTGKTQTDVARATGVSRSLVAHWEKDDARPTAEQLQLAAYALGASGEEIAVLSTRTLAETPLPMSREALLDRYAHAPFWAPDATEASDRLFLLTLLGGAGRLLRAGKADPGDMALIVSNFGDHAEMYHNDLQARDFYRRRALALAKDAREPIHFHLVTSIRGLLDAKANPKPLRERLSSAIAWQPRLQSRAGQAYLLSFLAGAMAAEAPELALPMGDLYCSLVADDPDEYPCRLHDRGNLLRKCGRAAESVAYLAALKPQDTYREGLVQMDMARGLMELGAKAEASRCLAKAKQILAGKESALLLSEFTTFDRALS